jgi:hypothetical protein
MEAELTSISAYRGENSGAWWRHFVNGTLRSPNASGNYTHDVMALIQDTVTGPSSKELTEAQEHAEQAQLHATQAHERATYRITEEMPGAVRAAKSGRMLGGTA